MTASNAEHSPLLVGAKKPPAYTSSSSNGFDTAAVAGAGDPHDAAPATTSNVSDSEDPCSSGAKDGSRAAAEATPSFTRSQLQLLACLCLGTLFTNSCSIIQMPFFPGEAERRGLSLAEASIVFSCYSFVEMFSYPVMGWLAPRVGVRRLYLAGLGFAGLATIAFGALTYVEDARSFLVGCMVARSAEAVGTAAAQTCSRTLAINQCPRRVNTAIGAIESTSAGSLCLAPALGGAMYTLGGYSLPFYVLGGLMICCVLFGMAVMPVVQELPLEETESMSGESGGAPRLSYLRMLAIVTCLIDNWLSFIVELVSAMNWWALDPSLEPYVSRVLGMEPAEFGMFYVASFGAYALASPLFSRLADAVDNTFLLLAFCLAPMAVGVLLMPPSPLLGLTPSRLLLGAGMVVRETFQVGAFVPLVGLTLRTSVARGLPSDVHGQAVVASALMGVYAAGRVVLPVAGAAAIEHVGLPMMATYLAMVTMVVALVLLVRGLVYLYCQRQRRVEEKGAEEITVLLQNKK